MRVSISNLWFCPDCTVVAVNDDSTGIDDEAREHEVREAVCAMGPHLVNDSGEDGEGSDEFSWRACDCCGSPLGGARERFAVLEPADIDWQALQALSAG